MKTVIARCNTTEALISSVDDSIIVYQRNQTFILWLNEDYIPEHRIKLKHKNLHIIYEILYETSTHILLMDEKHYIVAHSKLYNNDYLNEFNRSYTSVNLKYIKECL